MHAATFVKISSNQEKKQNHASDFLVVSLSINVGHKLHVDKVNFQNVIILWLFFIYNISLTTAKTFDFLFSSNRR